MILLNQFKENLILNYELLKPYEKGSLAPRKGYYLIKKVDYRSIGNFIDVPIAYAYWSDQADSFLEDTLFEVQLLSLYQEFSEGPKEIDRDCLIGKVIHIKETGISKASRSGAIKHALYVKWNIVNNPIKILSNQDIFFKVFFKSTNSLTEALEEFNATLPASLISEMLMAEQSTYESTEEYYEGFDDTDSLSDYDDPEYYD